MGQASLLIGRLVSITSVFFVLMSSRCSHEVGGGRRHQAAADGNDDDDCSILNGHRSTLYLGYWEISSKGKKGFVHHILRNRSVGARLIAAKAGYFCPGM